MSKRAAISKKKLALLSYIEDRKQILFGNFKVTTNKEKQTAWEEVLEKAKALELVSADREWTYVRDNIFGLWKSRSMSSKYLHNFNITTNLSAEPANSILFMCIC